MALKITSNTSDVQVPPLRFTLTLIVFNMNILVMTLRSFLHFTFRTGSCMTVNMSRNIPCVQFSPLRFTQTMIVFNINILVMICTRVLTFRTGSCMAVTVSNNIHCVPFPPLRFTLTLIVFNINISYILIKNPMFLLSEPGPVWQWTCPAKSQVSISLPHGSHQP